MGRTKATRTLLVGSALSALALVVPAAASAQVTPSLATQATGGQLGTTISATATLSGGDSPTGSITLSAWAPNRPACTNGPVHAQTLAVDGNGPYSSSFTSASGAGTYRWIASYSGDAGNSAVSGACGDAGSTSEVTKATPALATQATASVVVGGTMTDSATMSGAYNPTGTIVFRAYGPDDPACTGTPAHVSPPVGVTSNRTYNAPPQTTAAAGTYRWIAFYSGDFNNNSVSSACNAAGQTTTVEKATPAISAAEATPSVTIGDQLTDVASLEGGYNPTGTLTFKAYGPDDATCTGAAAFAGTTAVTGAGRYGPDSLFTPTAAGAYRWVVSYSGDSNNVAISGACNDPGQGSTVEKATPSISSAATPSVALGGRISDTATLAGGFNPSGTVTFRAYGPDDAGCTGPVAFTDAEAASGSGTATTNPTFGPTAAGAYRWVVSYGGDANNAPASSVCNAPGSTSTVTAAPSPSNEFTIGQLRDGFLQVTVKSAGTVRIAESKVLKSTSATGGPGVVKVPVRLKPAALIYLLLTGKLKFDAVVTFTPKGGTPATKSAKLAFEIKRKGHDKSKGKGKGRK